MKGITIIFLAAVVFAAFISVRGDMDPGKKECVMQYWKDGKAAKEDAKARGTPLSSEDKKAWKAAMKDKCNLTKEDMDAMKQWKKDRKGKKDKKNKGGGGGGGDDDNNDN